MSRAPTPAEQRYLLALPRRGAADRTVGAGELAGHLRARPDTVSAALSRLAAAGWVGREARVGVRLTEAGVAEARRVARRQRLAELLLVRVLGLGHAEAAAEAASLQHALSPRVERAIAAHLGEPAEGEQSPATSPF